MVCVEVPYEEEGRCGVLQIGDRILAINDWCTASGTAEEANYIIRHASGPLNLTVEFDVMETVLPSSGIFTVKLAKRGQNLGITLNNSATGHKGESVTVKDIRLGSVSHRCGSIQPDDQILSIDNIPLDTCTVDEAIRLLQKSSDIIKLRVKKNYTPFDDMEPATNTVVYTVELSRKGGPLGVTVASTDDNVDPIVISHLAPGGIAEKTGALHVGDRILAINGHSLNGKRVSEAVQLMKQNKDTVSFKIARFVLDHSRYGHHGHILTRGLLMDRPVMVDHYLDMDADGKLGTPVQSIDSAVESLEDSPLAECQQPCTSSSNRNSQNSNSKASSVSGGGGGTMDAAPFAEDLHIQLHKTLSTLKSAGSSSTGSSGQTSHGCRSEVSSSVSMAPTEDEQHYVQLGGESCPCKTHSNCDQQSHQDW
uniref:PDZ domain-containing protein n=1 Tax=Romanomermis culicivorax TaxID=13658 RepID=A0A915I865_ROMCU